MRRLLILALPLVAACAAGPAPQEGPSPATEMRAPPAPQVGGGVTGRWSSPSCGERTYERRIVLGVDGSFSSEDRVAPCPPTARCFWSGIVVRHGKYTIAGGTIELAAEGPSAGPGQPLPSSLVIDATGAPVEVLADGKRCPYVRAP
jgi:hypothetical protein